MYAKNYSQNSGQPISSQQMVQEQQNQMSALKGLQLQSLMKEYPQTAMHKKSDSHEEHKVPLQLKISSQPLYIKVQLSNDFPLTKPNIIVLSRVSHPNIEPNTYSYCGPVLQNWSESSSLLHVVQTIHNDFNNNPPIPVSMQGVIQGQAAGQKYVPEQINLQRPQFQQFKNQVNQMSSAEKDNLKDDQDTLLNLMLASGDQDADQIKTQLNKQMTDALNLAQSNLKQKQEMDQLSNQYQKKFEEYSMLKFQYESLQSQEQQILNKMSKQKIQAVLDKTITKVENEGRALEKQFQKGGLDKNCFIDQFVKQRKDFHKFSILKIKVLQS
eukprot:403354943